MTKRDRLSYILNRSQSEDITEVRQLPNMAGDDLGCVHFLQLEELDQLKDRPHLFP